MTGLVSKHPADMDFEKLAPTEAEAPTDTDLWLALRAGQNHALGSLYDRHGGLVYGIALKVLTHPQEAEDLTQDIFVKLAHSTAYDPQRGSFRTFLAILTRSRAIDRLRSRQVARASVERLQATHGASPAPCPAEALPRQSATKRSRRLWLSSRTTSSKSYAWPTTKGCRNRPSPSSSIRP